MNYRKKRKNSGFTPLNNSPRRIAPRGHSTGFTLVELLVALTIMVVVITPLTIALIKNGQFMVRNKEKLIAESVASEQIEIIRNLPYDDVGIDTGWPHGILKTCPDPITKDGIKFQVEVIIDDVDDPYDGCNLGTSTDKCYAPEKPEDPHGNDYKKAEVIVSPYSNREGKPIEADKCTYPGQKTTLTTDISRSGPETDAETGVLQVSVNDASGGPVADANVDVTNVNLGIYITGKKTSTNGKITFYALPIDDNYHIVTTKTGHSTDQTYPISEENPNPTPKDQSVLLLQLTSISFSIDLLSAMTINTVDINGAPILDPVTFTIHSEKKIGSDGLGNPIYKYTSIQTTSSGSINFIDMEWDSYTFTLDGASAIQFAILDTSVDPPEIDISTSVSLPPNSESSFNIVLTAGPAQTPSPNP
ncbi:MAG: prepilin-type N-terminal cleavage/methylation domain-containing protein [Candidatus Berkelbacteria bacterium]|nr:prepilin-type N-terminal cleavage/methylation domain-containing protein [Candidatus Berkelbacteria bacterium]